MRRGVSQHSTGCGAGYIGALHPSLIKRENGGNPEKCMRKKRFKKMSFIDDLKNRKETDWIKEPVGGIKFD